MEFTKEQQAIISSNSKINVALSTPGSGKSTVIIGRATKIWLETKEPILICTFSNKTLNDIKEKLGDSAAHIEVKTIHSLAFSIVKEHWNLVGSTLGIKNWPKEVSIADKALELDLFQKSFGVKVNISPIEFYNQICKFRELGLQPSTFQSLLKKGAYFGPFQKQILDIIPQYEKLRLQRGIITFNDMVNLCNYILPEPEVTIPLSRKWSHIMIDEAQDTSEDQWNILRPLVNNSISTLCVGDLNQSLYSWRNADGSVLSSLVNHKDAEVFRLTQSFRTAENIADFANEVVHDKSSQIETTRFGGDLILKDFETQAEEVDFILQYADQESAILARTNSYLEPFERELIKQGKFYKGTSFYRSQFVKEVVDFCSDIEDDLVALKALRKVFLDSDAYSDEEKDEFSFVLSRIKKMGLQEFLATAEAAQNLYGAGVTLMTGHSAKGLEWTNVFLVGASKVNLPHRLSDNLVEERNIFYVMSTRAKDFLCISYFGAPSIFIPQKHLSNG